jgi:NADPH-dependent 2,4-dienoyl-CoA reductase/sulfur reductase-like enzyme
MSAYLHDKYASHGIHILARTRPERLEGSTGVGRAVLDSGDRLDVDMVVMGVGIRLNTQLAQEAGLEMGEQGAVLVDELLRTSDPDIYAAGDIAAWPDPTYGQRLRVEHWDVAFRQGMRVGRNMAGEEKPYRTLPYFFSDMFDLSLEVWGHLAAWDRTVLRGTIESGSYAFYYFEPDASSGPGQGKLTGVLAVGRPEEERKPMPALVKARPAYADVADKLADGSTDLAGLVG